MHTLLKLTTKEIEEINKLVSPRSMLLFISVQTNFVLDVQTGLRDEHLQSVLTL